MDRETEKTYQGVLRALNYLEKHPNAICTTTGHVDDIGGANFIKAMLENYKVEVDEGTAGGRYTLKISKLEENIK